MNIEEIYDLELKYQEVYKRTKDYTRNDFVIELIKKDDEKQELIDYLREKIKEYTLPLQDKNSEALGYSLPIKGVYQEILSKIEKG